MNWFKKTPVMIKSKQQVELEGLETWIVRWMCRDYSSCVYPRPMAQAFTNEVDARSFGHALQDALRLIGNKTDSKYIEVSKV